MTVLNSERSPLILLGNADKYMRMELARRLEKDGYQVLESCNADQCIEAYTLFHPDFVILDAQMPDLDGFTDNQSIVESQQALELEINLKQITNKTRNSLDEKQILSTAVQELAKVLGAGFCNAALYEPGQNTSSIRYEYTSVLPEFAGYAIDINLCPEVREQLKQGQSVEFCATCPDPVLDRVAMFGCPIADEDGLLGDLLLIDSEYRIWNELEKQLVQQVTQACAIAIRQARLYQIAQARITELEKLHHLKDEFISLVTHELRSPMTALRLGIQTLQYVLPQARVQCGEAALCNTNCTKSIHYLNILNNECEQQITLLNDLLSLQRIEAKKQILEPAIIQLQDWIEEVTQPFKRRVFSRQQSLNIRVSPHLSTVISDPTILKSILVELLNNACKYTPPDETINLTVTAESDKLRLQVCNSGVEIPAKALPRIFEKFYRVPDGDPWKQGGTGLGLALVKKQIGYLGGNIQVKSVQRETCFTVELPLPSST